eukprot:CAMPEP_0196578948 /NCGR_PEP_ID=MMETSP1081-20130531/13595_1 /TAXON_ID=36882 /ORGANISM="Pyramimonas amylifera, Strain CCMP720" /LENGTH=168 /DNA_ID=CAMNT_0041898355 /DNA_START=35 /DNA_END=541 /DNA_ORIENTATION=+
MSASPEDLLSQPIEHHSRRVGPVLLVEQVMTRKPKYLKETMPIREAMMTFLSAEFSGFPVLDSEGKLVGVLSMSDIMWHETMEALILEQQKNKGLKKTRFLDGCVGDSMTSPAVSIPEDKLISQAASLMMQEKVNRVAVTGAREHNVGKLVGMLTRADIMKCMAAALM